MSRKIAPRLQARFFGKLPGMSRRPGKPDQERREVMALLAVARAAEAAYNEWHKWSDDKQSLALGRALSRLKRASGTGSKP